MVTFPGPQDIGDIALCNTVLAGRFPVTTDALLANDILTWLAVEVGSVTLVEMAGQSDVSQLFTNACSLVPGPGDHRPEAGDEPSPLVPYIVGELAGLWGPTWESEDPGKSGQLGGDRGTSGGGEMGWGPGRQQSRFLHIMEADRGPQRRTDTESSVFSPSVLLYSWRPFRREKEVADPLTLPLP